MRGCVSGNPLLWNLKQSVIHEISYKTISEIHFSNIRCFKSHDICKIPGPGHVFLNLLYGVLKRSFQGMETQYQIISIFITNISPDFLLWNKEIKIISKEFNPYGLNFAEYSQKISLFEINKSSVKSNEIPGI